MLSLFQFDESEPAMVVGVGCLLAIKRYRGNDPRTGYEACDGLDVAVQAGLMIIRQAYACRSDQQQRADS
jgi:hypothetical protein